MAQLRATVADNQIYDSIFSPGTSRTTLDYWPVTFGSANSDSFRAMDQGWYSSDTSTVNSPNSFTIIAASLQYNGVSVPVTWAGSRTKTINPGDVEVLSDPIQPGEFGAAAFVQNTVAWYKVERLLPSDTASIMHASGKKIGQRAASHAWAIDKANTTIVNGVDVVGPFTVSGAAQASRNNGYCPFFVGTFVEGDPETYAICGDSILAGSGDTGASVPIGIGIGQRVLYGDGTNILGGMNISRSGTFAANFGNSPGDRLAALTKYCKYAIEEFGTNDLGTTGTTITAAACLALLRANWLRIKSYGVTKIIRTKLLPRSTGTWTSDASQTVAAGWDAGGNVETLNNSFAAEVLSGNIESVVNMDAVRSPTNYYKWISTGAANYATSDGTHPSTAAYVLVSPDVRSAADAIINTYPIGVKPMATTWEKTGADSAQHDKNRTFQVSGNLSLGVADSGKSFIVKSGTSIFTLPATVPGLIYTIQYQGKDGGGQIQISPAAADGIGAAGSAVVNKDLILATATIKQGDFVKITSGVGATGVTAWHMIDQRGIVTKEA